MYQGFVHNIISQGLQILCKFCDKLKGINWTTEKKKIHFQIKSENGICPHLEY